MGQLSIGAGGWDYFSAIEEQDVGEISTGLELRKRKSGTFNPVWFRDDVPRFL
ncbi:MAG TPA: hypothetical protein VNW25_06255 [Candidatus Sulfotelmatobacter sp.]|nr:hypothetical protein [Candidatus Sulfotelmatobacter sp.]